MTEPMMKGRFTLYETPDGGYHIAYLADDTEETRHIEVPGPLVSLAKAGAEGKLNPLAMARMFMGGTDASVT
jgi:hypothetical protein